MMRGHPAPLRGIRGQPSPVRRGLLLPVALSAAGVTSGSRPLADVVTRSTGTGAAGFCAARVAASPFTRSISVFEVGPLFEPPEFAALYGAGTVFVESFGSVSVVAEGRPWKYFSAVKFCPISSEPTTLLSRSIKLPAD